MFGWLSGWLPWKAAPADDAMFVEPGSKIVRISVDKEEATVPAETKSDAVAKLRERTGRLDQLLQQQQQVCRLPICCIFGDETRTSTSLLRQQARLRNQGQGSRRSSIRSNTAGGVPAAAAPDHGTGHQSPSHSNGSGSHIAGGARLQGRLAPESKQHVAPKRSGLANQKLSTRSRGNSDGDDLFGGNRIALASLREDELLDLEEKMPTPSAAVISSTVKPSSTLSVSAAVSVGKRTGTGSSSTQSRRFFSDQDEMLASHDAVQDDAMLDPDMDTFESDSMVELSADDDRAVRRLAAPVRSPLSQSSPAAHSRTVTPSRNSAAASPAQASAPNVGAAAAQSRTAALHISMPARHAAATNGTARGGGVRVLQVNELPAQSVQPADAGTSKAIPARRRM